MSHAANPLMVRRSAGILCHLSSLRGSCAIGDLGSCAHEFVAWCQGAGMTWWQMLPVGPIGPGESPYASTSSFAGESLFISLEGLRDIGLLAQRDLRESSQAAKKFSRGRGDRAGSHAKTDYDAARRAKEPAFLRAFESFRSDGGFSSKDYRAFSKRERFWLSGWQSFMRDATGYHAFLQFAFDTQWRQLRDCAKRHGVKLLGDLPIFVTRESADVDEHQELFRLDRRGRPEVLTGVPPDCFSKNGQLWGHPHYRWRAHRTERFAWWTARIAASLSRFDAVRIDHFVGFHHAYEIPAGARTARRGAWKPQAGAEVLAAARRALKRLPLLAEDLGAVTPEISALRKRFGLPGMTVLHHAFGHDRAASERQSAARASVVYSATHDNDTTLGWFAKLDSPAKTRFCKAAGDGAAVNPSEAIIRLAFESPAQLAIIPLQDALGLDRNARMNLPGTPRGNWRWRLGADWRLRAKKTAQNLQRLAVLTHRIP
ncbi:MAG: 4-alpha-glucanotransferase [Phycisphaerales bacterium]|nr:4-alpha-glucanotransferase [Phycisphaerales bacterium]